jgi:hypothetical protein
MNLGPLGLQPRSLTTGPQRSFSKCFSKIQYMYTLKWRLHWLEIKQFCIPCDLYFIPYVNPRAVLPDHVLLRSLGTGPERPWSCPWTQIWEEIKFRSLEVYTGKRGARGSIVVKALCYKPEGRGFVTRWGEWFVSIYLILPTALGPGVYSASNRNEYQKHKSNVSGE